MTRTVKALGLAAVSASLFLVIRKLVKAWKAERSDEVEPDEVELASEESFPASDPPAWNAR